MRKYIKLIITSIIMVLSFFLISCSLNTNNDDSKEPETQKNQYTITYYINSDSLDKISVVYDESTEISIDLILSEVFLNNTPIKDGYIAFTDSWYYDEAYSMPVSFPYTVTADASFYLKWTSDEAITPENSYTISYYVDNEVFKTEYVEENNKAKGTNDPEKDGYTFAGWYTTKTFSTKYDFDSAVTKNIKLYAKFDIKTYEIEFIDTTNNSTISTQIVKYNNKINKPSDPSKAHYEFIGWYSDSSCSTEFDFSSKITSAVKVYAKFNAVETFTVEFLDNEGNTVAEKQIVDKNSYASKPDNPIKMNHVFNGWFTDLEYTDEFLFTNKITTNTKVYAKFTYFELSETEIIATNYGGYAEGAFVEFTKLANTTRNDYTISYKLNSSSAEVQIDSELIRENDLTVRADLLGLKAGTYTIYIKSKNTTISKAISNIVVSSQDRSGYAHFNNSTGVGAYNNDGTLKGNTTVVYVNDTNKNTVTATIDGKTYTGLVNILQNQSKSSNPLLIRIVGRIGAATWKTIDYPGSSLSASQIIGANGVALKQANMTEDEIISNGYNSLDTSVATKLNGLANRLKYSGGEFDSYFNMLDVSNVSNVTIEGVGSDAEIFQWGFTWSKCNSIEVRNLTFTSYPEDACSFQGGSNSDVNKYGNYWVHNNTFNKGNNNWDVTYEQDKPAGDGATDFKFCNSITSSYNKFNNCKKTGLVGGSNNNYTRNVTFHHNYYNEVGSRLPLGRQANMHIYNNYYYKCSTAQDIRANAFVLSEANYFENCSNPQKVTNDDTYKSTVIKSFGDYFTGCGDSQATVVTSRTQSLSGNCKPDGSTNYTNFDTNSSLFYYDSTNKKSNVTLLTDAATAKIECINNSGVLKGAFTANNNSSNNSNTNTDNNTNNDSTNNDSNTENNENTIITNSSMLTINSFSAGDVTATTTKDNLTITPKSGKTCKVYNCEKTVNSTAITKYLYLGGAGSFNELNVKITTTAKANITIYFGSSTAGRTVKLMTEEDSITALTTTISNEVVSYKFEACAADTYAIASTNSGIDIYCVIIEYIE